MTRASEHLSIPTFEIFKKLCETSLGTKSLQWDEFCEVTGHESVFANVAEAKRNDFALFETILVQWFGKESNYIREPREQMWLVSSLGVHYIFHLHWRNTGPGMEAFLRVLLMNPSHSEYKKWKKKFKQLDAKGTKKTGTSSSKAQSGRRRRKHEVPETQLPLSLGFPQDE